MSTFNAWFITGLAIVLTWFGVVRFASGATLVGISAVISLAIVVAMSSWLGERFVPAVGLASGIATAAGWAGATLLRTGSNPPALVIFGVWIGASVVGFFVAAGAARMRERRA